MALRVLFLVMALVAMAPADAQNRSALESNIIGWSQEKLQQHEQFNRVGPAAEWRKKIQEQDHEWLAVSLAVAYSVEKRVNEGLKGDRPDTPILDDNIARLRGRLAQLGQYVVIVNR